MKRIGYFRVSKEDETEQDLDAQIEAVKDKFNLKSDLVVFKERGSAYNLDKITNRVEFFKMLEVIFSSKFNTIEDLFAQKFLISEPIELYIWDYSRIIRNFEYSLLFGILCDFYNVTIFSFKQGVITKKEEEKPSETFARYVLYSINAFSNEDYSWNISQNVKKNVMKDKNITFSSKGNKWGGQFRDSEGNNVKLSAKDITKLNNRIKKLIEWHIYNKKVGYYDEIVQSIIKEFKIKISKGYISKIKNGN